jgi:tRNA pseudouridine38-40 synthase
MARPSDDNKQGSESSRRARTGVRRFRALVEYDGTEFAGFQFQPGVRTVQGELEAALARLTGGIRQPVDGAGRTDAGVHAIGQVIAFGYDGLLSLEALAEALNGNLPRDVAIRNLRRAPRGFHPRFAARYREYRYTIWTGPRSPLRDRTAFRVRNALDVEAMARAAAIFQGRHDFSAFGGTDPQPVRTIQRIRVSRRGDEVTIDVRANAFLRGMVRRIVAALIGVGKGRIDEAAIVAALAGSEPAFAGAAAPARGLCLRKVALGRTKRNTTDRSQEQRGTIEDQ